MQPHYTVKEAAEILKVNEATIYRAIKAGTINYRCAGKKAYRFTEEDLLSYLAAPTRDSVQPTLKPLVAKII